MLERAQKGLYADASSVELMQRSISRCDSYAHVPDAILGPISERLGAIADTFFQFRVLDSYPGVLERSLFRGPFTQAAEIYFQHRYRDDPMLAMEASSPKKLSDITAGKNYQSDHKLYAYCNGFLAAHGIGDVIGIQFPVGCGLAKKIVAVGFFRGRFMPNYTAGDMALLDELAPTLRLALSNLALAAEIRMMDDVLSNLLAQMNAGIQLRDKQAGVNYVFESAPANDGTLSLGCDHLPANLSLHLLRKTASERSSVSKFGLTTREEEIVNALRGGHNNSSMAIALGISVRTVENHLRSIYGKVEVNSRVQLLSRLMVH